MYCFVLCLLCLCARLFICALWSHARKGLTSWLSFVVSYFPIGILGQVWYLIVSSMSEITPCYKTNKIDKPWDKCNQNFHLGRYIVGYTVGNNVLRQR